MPHKLNILQVCFDGDIARHELPALRGAIARKAGLKHTLFHNHEGDGFRYGYPLIQYKRISKQPALVCVGAGVDAVHHFFNKRDWAIEISGRTIPMRVASLDLRQHLLQVWDQQFHFRIGHWLALHQEAHLQYLALPDEAARTAFLQRKLIGNILSFAKGIGWHVDKPISLTVHTIERMQSVPFKDSILLAFDVDFSTNVSLPPYIGLGKGTSLGNGILRPWRAQAVSGQLPPAPTPPQDSSNAPCAVSGA